jgi:hypothetical protein
MKGDKKRQKIVLKSFAWEKKTVVYLQPLKTVTLAAEKFIARIVTDWTGSDKKTFKKRLYKFCGNKKRVLYLHPLKGQETLRER